MKKIIKSLLILNLLFIISCANRKQTIHLENHDSIANKLDVPVKGNKEYTVILGKLLDQIHIPGVLPSNCFEENVVCMDSYYLNEIQIYEVLSGDPLSGTIHAVRMQHSEYFYKGDDLFMFVISNIKNPKSINLLRTKYYLEDDIQPRTEYCFPNPINKYFKKTFEKIDSDCLEESFVLNQFKEEQIETIISDIESQLKLQGLLIKLETEYSDGMVILEEETDEEFEEWEQKCPTEFNLDKHKDKPGCYSFGNIFEVVQFSLVKDKAEIVKSKIQDNLEQSGIVLSNIQMNFIIKEQENMSILEWHYRVNH